MAATPSVLVPCLGHSSARGLPPAAVCPGCPQTSPGWRAHYSRSPGCRHSCARRCRFLSAECSSPGCQGKAESSTRVTPCCPEAWGAEEPQQETTRGGGGREWGPEPDEDEEGLPCPHATWGQAWAGVPTTLPPHSQPCILSESHHLPGFSLRSASLIPPFPVC